MPIDWHHFAAWNMRLASRYSGAVLSGQGKKRATESEMHLRAAIAVGEKMKGFGYAGSAVIHHDLGVVLQAQGRVLEAEMAYRRCVARAGSGAAR